MYRLIFVAIALAGGAVGAETVVFRGVNVIPMTAERVLADQTVLVEDGLITAVGNVSEVDVPNDATVIDATGKYLIPGLYDLHTHFFGGRDGYEGIARMLALNGVTGVLNMNGSRGVLEIRERVEAGEVIGPKVFAASPILGNTSPSPKTFEDGVARVEEFHGQGYDFIKVYNQIPKEGYEGVMSAAKRLDIPVVGHAVRSVGLEGAMANGQHMAHMEEIIYGYFGNTLEVAKIEPLARRMKDAGIACIATLVCYHNIIRQVEDIDAMLASEGIEYLPEALVRQWQPEKNQYLKDFDAERVERQLRPSLMFMRRLTRAFVDAGVPVLAGTDCTIPIVVPGWSLHDELRELVDAGLSPYEALEAATVKAADFLNDGAGTIEAGKRADLILLEANPLEDIGNTNHRAGVMVRGTWYAAGDIERLLEEIRP